MRLVDALAFEPAPAEADARSADRGAVAPDPVSEEPRSAVLTWLPIFGVPEAPPPEEEIVAPEPPPSFDYDLKGVIASGEIRWAILSGSDGDLIVREGDRVDDALIRSIHSGGIDVELGGETLSVRFSEDRPVEVAEVALDRTEPVERSRGNFQTEAEPEIQEVIYQGMTQDELREVVRKAQERQRERGIGTPQTE